MYLVDVKWLETTTKYMQHVFPFSTSIAFEQIFFCVTFPHQTSLRKRAAWTVLTSAVARQLTSQLLTSRFSHAGLWHNIKALCWLNIKDRVKGSFTPPKKCGVWCLIVLKIHDRCQGLDKYCLSSRKVMVKPWCVCYLYKSLKVSIQQDTGQTIIQEYNQTQRQNRVLSVCAAYNTANF